MAWRQHATHGAETRAVKRALREYGIEPERVTHGRGTAWAWLRIYLPAPGHHSACPDHQGRHPVDCPYNQLRRRVYRIVVHVTGRPDAAQVNVHFTD